jgi:hypothetical protein
MSQVTGVDDTRRRVWPDEDRDGEPLGPRAGAGTAAARVAADAEAYERLAGWIQGGSANAVGDAAPGSGGLDVEPKVDHSPGGPDKTKRPSQVFVLEDKDANAIDPKDVQQYLLGDCHLMAPLAALASTQEGRKTIGHAIWSSTDAMGQPCYCVRLYQRTWYGTLQPKTIKVSADDVYAEGHARARTDGKTRGDGKPWEIWPLVIEKAYAQLHGGYKVIATAGSPAAALEALTGQPAKTTTFGIFSGYSEKDLRADLVAGKAIVFRTPASTTKLPYGLVDKHAYSVEGIEERDGWTYVKLRNPWGREDPEPIPLVQLRKLFSAVDTCDPRAAR